MYAKHVIRFLKIDGFHCLSESVGLVVFRVQMMYGHITADDSILHKVRLNVHMLGLPQIC